MTKLKVHLHKVSRSDNARNFEDALDSIGQLPIDQRVRRVGYHDIRLEHVVPPQTGANGTPYWLIDFIKLRYDHGPGKVSHGAQIECFQLQPGEGFGEETAALYDAENHYLLVQYNHHGVRASSIRNYMSNFFHDVDVLGGYEFAVKLDNTSELKLANKQFITKLQCKIAPQQMTAAHRAHNVSLDRALELNNDQGGGSIEIIISAPRGQSLISRRIGPMIEALKEWRGADAEEETRAVRTFQVDAKAQLEDKAERIDLLMPALEVELDGLVLGQDLRYTLQSRWECLQRARRGWENIIEA